MDRVSVFKERGIILDHFNKEKRQTKLMPNSMSHASDLKFYFS